MDIQTWSVLLSDVPYFDFEIFFVSYIEVLFYFFPNVFEKTISISNTEVRSIFAHSRFHSVTFRFTYKLVEKLKKRKKKCFEKPGAIGVKGVVFS